MQASCLWCFLEAQIVFRHTFTQSFCMHLFCKIIRKESHDDAKFSACKLSGELLFFWHVQKAVQMFFSQAEKKRWFCLINLNIFQETLKWLTKLKDDLKKSRFSSKKSKKSGFLGLKAFNFE